MELENKFNIVLDIDDVNGDGKYNVNDFLDMKNEDIIKENGGKKFDICLMNPPYAQNLHLKFLDKVIKISENVVSIQPYVWLNKNKLMAPIGKYRNVFNGKMDDIEYISHDEANELFHTGNSLEALGIFTLTQHGKIDLLHYGFNPVEQKLFEKINIFTDKVITFHKCIKYSKKITDIKDKYFVPIYTWHGDKDCYNAVVMTDERANKRVGAYLVFNSSEEVNNFKESLKTKFMDWYYYTFIVPSDCKIKNTMFILKDYSKPVTDETFYKLFDLTKEEIKIIKDFKPNV